MYGDIDPYYDECSDSNHTSTSAAGILTGENIGDLLNAKAHHLGLVPGRLHADLDQRAAARSAAPSTRTSAAPRCRTTSPH